MTNDITLAKKFKQKKFTLLGLTGEWLQKYGDVEAGKSFFFWGQSGSGKSTEVIKFFDFLTLNYGKGLYIAGEEGLGKTLQNRIESKMSPKNNNYSVCSQKTSYKNLIAIEQAKKSRARFKVIVIDSYQLFGDMKYRQYLELRDALPWATIIGINQMKGDGEPYGGNQIRHDADVKVCIKEDKGDMKVYIESRYIPESHSYVLYTKAKKTQNLTLFND